MKTLYIDVYFMINFTVDILAIFIALKLSNMKINNRKLVLGGVVGAILAIVELFIDSFILHIIIASVFIYLLARILCKGASFIRTLKFILLFYISAFLISGAVSFIYAFIDRWLDRLALDDASTSNRKALLFSLIILLLIGVIRLFILTLSNSIKERSSKIEITLDGKELKMDALIDTGNLVRDPMNMNPVIFIKKDYAEKIIPRSVIELSNLDSLTPKYRKRIRLIPVTRSSATHVMTGIRVDKVFICNGSHKEEIDATIVIDKEEGTYGGYFALTPYVGTE